MCVTNVYVDRYPDGKELEFRHTEICQYGAPGRPCVKLSKLENPVRNIQFGEPTTEYMIVAQHKRSQNLNLPQTPPRSAGGSHHRRQSSSVNSLSSEDRDKNRPGSRGSTEGGIRRRPSERERERDRKPTLRPTRTHRKERIIIVDSPPTPRTPPQLYNQTFSLPASPATPPFIIDGLPRERGRPIIVDERPLHREREREILREENPEQPRRTATTQQRSPSIGAVVGNRPRLSTSTSRERFGWDSPSSSHTSFSSRARREVEELERRKRARDDLEIERANREMSRELERKERDRIAMSVLEAERRREDRIRAQDEEIRRRPVVPIPAAPEPVVRKGILKTTNVAAAAAGGMSQAVPIDIPGGVGREKRLSTGERVLVEEKERRRRVEDRDREAREAREISEEEALRMRLRERQMPKRRFSVGPGGRRTRVVYDDGLYRWE